MHHLLILTALLATAAAMPEDTGAGIVCDEGSPFSDTDFDGDGLSDADELECGSDPCAPDTDLDGVWDGQEATGAHACGPDSDGDGVRDLLDPDDPQAGGSTDATITPESGSHGLSDGAYTGGSCSVGGTSPALLPALLIMGALLGRRRWPLLLWTASATSAHAIDVQRLDPNLDGSDFVWARDARIGAAGWGGGILSHYANTPAQYRSPAGNTGIVTDLWTTDLGAHWHHPRVGLSTRLPIHGWAQGLPVAQSRWLGDARISARVPLVDIPQVDIAATSQLGLPTGNSDGWLGTPGVHGAAGLAVSGGETVRWTVNLGGHWAQRTDLGELTWGSALSWRAGLGLPVTDALFVSAELDGLNQMIRSDAEGAHPAEAICSARWWSHDHLSFVLGGGSGITRGVGAPAYRALLGATWSADTRSPKATPTPTPPPAAATPAATPEPKPAPKTQATPAPVSLLKAPVRFSPGSAQLSLGAIERLKEVALVLLDHPELGAVQIQGHATGEKAASNTLSASRAEAVMIWLVDNGVAPERLSARGYGATKSGDIADSDAKERVEFHLVEPHPPSAQ